MAKINVSKDFFITVYPYSLTELQLSWTGSRLGLIVWLAGHIYADIFKARLFGFKGPHKLTDLMKTLSPSILINVFSKF